MANDLTAYTKKMIQLRQEYTALSKGNQPASAQAKAKEIKRLRYDMLADGHSISDLYEVEKAAKIAIDGKISPDWENGIRVSLTEVYLIQQYINLKTQHQKANAIDRKKIEEQIKQIRMRIHAIGYDAYAFEDLAQEIWTGEPMTIAERDIQYQAVKEAIAAYNRLDPNGKKALKALYDPKVGSIGTGSGEWDYDKTSELLVSDGAENDYAESGTARWVSSDSSGNITKTTQTFKDHYSHIFSGADMVVFFAFPGHRPIEIGTASTVSYTTYREKKQLRTLGRISAKGIVKGTRTISGRLIFTVIREHIVEQIRKEISYLQDIKTLLMDELPPFDILVSFGNEYGAGAGLVIQGTTTIDEQMTMSVEDLLTENLFTYLARAIEPMRDINSTRLNQPYDPLSWFTSSFRKPGSETIGTFKPKETQLYNDSKLLVAPAPFYGSVAGWDSSLYEAIDVGDYIVAGDVEGQTGDIVVSSPTADRWSAIPDKTRIFVQMYENLNSKANALDKVYILVERKQKGGKYEMYNGFNTRSYSVSDIDMGLEFHAPASSIKNQKYPIKESSNVWGVLFKDAFEIGDMIRIKATAPDFTTVTKEFTIYHREQAIMVEMKRDAGSNPGASDVAGGAVFIGDSATGSTGKSFEGANGVYVISFLPKKDLNFNPQIVGKTRQKIIQDYKVQWGHFSRSLGSLPSELYFSITNSEGVKIARSGVELYWSWQIFLDKATNVKSDAPFHIYEGRFNQQNLKRIVINETYGLKSNTLYQLKNEYYDQKNIPPMVNTTNAYYTLKSDSSGHVTVPLRAAFMSITDRLSERGFQGKRFPLYWDDLPANAFLAITVMVNKGGRMKDAAWVYLKKDSSDINWNTATWKAIEDDVKNNRPRYGAKNEPVGLW